MKPEVRHAVLPTAYRPRRSPRSWKVGMPTFRQLIGCRKERMRSFCQLIGCRKFSMQNFRELIDRGGLRNFAQTWAGLLILAVLRRWASERERMSAQNWADIIVDPRQGYSL